MRLKDAEEHRQEFHPGNGAIEQHWKSREQSQNGKHSPASSESGSEKVRRFSLLRGRQ